LYPTLNKPTCENLDEHTVLDTALKNHDTHHAMSKWQFSGSSSLRIQEFGSPFSNAVPSNSESLIQDTDIHITIWL
jgi:hypothetical protein